MKIIYSKAITKDVQKIKNKKLQQQIEQAILLLEEKESIDDIPSIKKMKGYQSAYRMRIGDYRLGFYLEKDCVKLARFAKRSDIYKLFP